VGNLYQEKPGLQKSDFKYEFADETESLEKTSENQLSSR
jgi:hypothetical protein